MALLNVKNTIMIIFNKILVKKIFNYVTLLYYLLLGMIMGMFNGIFTIYYIYAVILSFS